MPSMTLEEFKELTEGSWTTVDVSKYSHFYSKNKTEENKDVLFAKWHTGGYSGGSCWGGTPEYHSSDEKEPDFPLEDIFEKVCPDIKFLKFRKISKEIDSMVTTEEYTLPDYYGNSSDYKVKYLEIENLYNILVEEGII